jgi:hypothetical protein
LFERLCFSLLLTAVSKVIIQAAALVSTLFPLYTVFEMSPVSDGMREWDYVGAFSKFNERDLQP